MSIQDANILDRYAYHDSLVHRLDPRAKVLATLAFIVVVISHQKLEVVALLPFFSYPLALTIMSFLPLKVIARRILIAMPFVIAVGIFNPLLDRTPVLLLFGLHITSGWLSFASIILRGLLCVSAAVLLTGTTSFPLLIQALQALKMPPALSVQLMLLYRYLFLLIGQGQKISRAKALRSGTARTSLSTAGAMLSSLLMRTMDRGEAVFLAMKVRGFQGQIKTVQRLEWRPADTAFLLMVLGMSVMLRIFPITEIAAKIGSAL